jgi:sulfur transfer protein SufE
MNYPEKLQEYVDLFTSIQDRGERIELVAGLADRYHPVPESIAKRPYPLERRVEACESEVYFWAKESPEKRLEFYFAVENPQGVAAMATVAVLEETLSNAPLGEILNVDPEVVLTFFGQELSTRKRVGLMQIVRKIQKTVSTYQQKGRVE